MDDTYHTIVVDPPWPQSMVPNKGYQKAMSKKEIRPSARSKSVEFKSQRQPYQTMSIDEIRSLPIPGMAAPACNILVWTTQTMLHEAFHLLECWGAKYRCTTTWNKHRGMTTWRVSLHTEFLLCGYVGDAKEALPLKTWPTHFDVPAHGLRHSEKPAKIYRRIVECFPPPRCDYFARRVHTGFVPYGDQVEYLPHEQESLI